MSGSSAPNADGPFQWGTRQPHYSSTARGSSHCLTRSMAVSAPKRKLIRRRGPGREAERAETKGLEQPRGRPRAAAKRHATASGWRDCSGDNPAHLTAGSAADAWSLRRGAVAAVAHQHRGWGGGGGAGQIAAAAGGHRDERRPFALQVGRAPAGRGIQGWQGR